MGVNKLKSNKKLLSKAADMRDTDLFMEKCGHG